MPFQLGRIYVFPRLKRSILYARHKYRHRPIFAKYARTMWEILKSDQVASHPAIVVKNEEDLGRFKSRMQTNTVP